MLKTYYQLIKPGIIRGNVITAAAGFLLASKGNIDLPLLLATLIGISLVVASGCVFNNYIDRDIDRKMSRTRNRAIAAGELSAAHALIYGSLLGVAGTAILALFTNLLTVMIALIGFFFYVVVYSIGKRSSVYGTLIGSVSGAVPPVVGYSAASGSIDTAAVILFLVLVFWQMPHFYAIAIYRLSDYKAAGIPVLPAVKGMHRTKIEILLYTILFTVTTMMLSVTGYTGIAYLIVMTVIGLAWLVIGVQGLKLYDNEQWARSMFRYSLSSLLVFCLMISIETLLP